jgi:hypothetical protein
MRCELPETVDDLGDERDEKLRWMEDGEISTRTIDRRTGSHGEGGKTE